MPSTTMRTFRISTRTFMGTIATKGIEAAYFKHEAPYVVFKDVDNEPVYAVRSARPSSRRTR
jgi:hypothetical protein